MKPLGINISTDGRMRVTRTDPATDAIWEAVEAAVCCDMSSDEFIREARQAWAHEMKQKAAADDEAFD